MYSRFQLELLFYLSEPSEEKYKATLQLVFFLQNWSKA